MTAQFVLGDELFTIASSERANLLPGNDWHSANGIVILSKQEALQSITEVKINLQNEAEGVSSLNDSVEIVQQFNGRLTSFGEAFWKGMFNSNPGLLQFLSTEKIESVTYSDRYIQSPSSMLMITQLLGFLCKGSKTITSLIIETLYHEKDQSGKYLHHDWQDKDDFISAYEAWGEYQTSIKPQVICYINRSNIAHRRLLTLRLSSGKELIFKLDQGVGYWKLSELGSKFNTIRYSFQSDLDPQLRSLKELEEKLIVKNSEDWSTDVTYKVRSLS